MGNDEQPEPAFLVDPHGRHLAPARLLEPRLSIKRPFPVLPAGVSRPIQVEETGERGAT